MQAAYSKFSNTVYISEEGSGRECLTTLSTEEYAARNLTLGRPGTEWSGMSDKTEIKISIYGSKLKAEIASVVGVSTENRETSRPK